MITSWWPASFTVGEGNVQVTNNVHPQPMSTTAKVCQVSSFLYTLWWASLVYGAGGQLTDLFPAQFELSSLDGANGFIINGEASGDNSGRSASSAGDMNGDGINDLLIGALYADVSGKTNAGKCYVVFGGRSIGSGGTIDLSSLNATNGFILLGEAGDDQTGVSVSSLGDVNGDGIDDIVVGANRADPSGRSRAGKSYVVFGSRTVVNGGILKLSDLDGSNGFILNGEAAYDWSGRSVSFAGDVNGDGINDILIGAPEADPSGRRIAGKSYVVFGSRTVVSGGILKLSSLNGQNGFILKGASANDYSGFSVSSAGDVNGDGLSDILIGAYLASPSGRASAGKSYVVFGSRNIISGSTLELSSLNGQNGFALNGESANDYSGVSVSTAGDVNGDGIDDIIIGANRADPLGRSAAGKSYVVFGSRAFVKGGKLDLSSLNGTNGFIINGEAASDLSGRSVSSAGDVNGDDLSDVVIGAYMASPSGRKNAGKSYVVFGSRNAISGGTLFLSSLNGSNGFILNGEAVGDSSGVSVNSAGDVNGDGLPDLVIGARNADPSGRSDAGKSYVVFGRNLTPSTQSPPSSLGSTSSLPNTDASTISSFHSSGTAATYSQLVSIPSLVASTSLQSTHFEDRISTQSSTIKSPILMSTAATNVLLQSPSSDSTPLIAVIAAAVGAFACSLFAGGLFVCRRKTTKSENRDKTSMKSIEFPHTYDSSEVSLRMQKAGDDEMQSARYDQLQSEASERGIYTTVPTAKPQSNYNEWPQESGSSEPKQYTSIDKVEKAHDAYVAAKFEKAHSNYDDLQT